MDIIDESKLSSGMKQYMELKRQNPDCILFYRLGDFYEMFMEDAIIASKELEITLTGKDCGLEERAPMCGVPYHAYEGYAQKLLEKGYKVAICEQINQMDNKIMKREVVRIITPGTIIDSAMLNDSSNSYFMCIYINNNTVSYSYGDISTGEICVEEYSGENIANYINDQIVRISPAEIICNTKVQEIASDISCIQTGLFKLNLYYEWAYSYSNAEKIVLKQYNLSSLKGHDFATKNCVIAIGAMLEYFKETQKRELKHLKMPKLLQDNQFMYLDNNTRRNLEIERSMHNATKQGSLLWVLDDTQTAGGARLLKNWVRQPLQNVEKINKRLSMIESLTNNALIQEDLKHSLSKIQDIERFIGRIAYGNITPKDCISLANSLAQVPEVKNAIMLTNNADMLELSNNLVDVSEIVNLINATISLDAPATLKDGGYINKGFNQELDNLRNLKQNSEDIIISIQAREREDTGIKNLKIGYNRVFGYYIEVNKMYSDLVPFHYVRKQTISNNERYITEELKELENKILTSKEDAIKLEEYIFELLKEQLLQNASILQQIATTISNIDCIYSLSSVAVKNDYVKPTLTNDNSKLNIINGRHPIVEKINKSDFISNDCTLNNSDQRTIILTGPNMAGKSTFMRQVALITLMAHIGSFVPAESATICIVDRIFTRIGASDDLAVGQSTFMVEMIEVANILNFCTNNSLIILDEVGRGTSTFDGLSIAWSVVEYLSKKVNAKTLFATHYHELMQLEGKYDGVRNFCIAIKEIGGKLVFLRKIMRGSATRSYGIEVASLAGLPTEVIERAKELITELENDKISNSSSSYKDSELHNIIKEIDINRLTPMAAFDVITHLKNLLK